MSALRLANLAALAVMPFVITGVLNRVKSLWSGRRGPPLLQSLFDARRLLRKTSVYSETSTAVFRAAPYVLLATSLASAAIAPLLGASPMLPFAYDFVAMAYLWALGRGAVMLAALDTGSSFEAMGAAREATFATLLEPATFMVLGALSLLTGARSLHEALAAHLRSGQSVVVWLAALVALTIVLQVETARMPVDDPSTHLELTMIHEVMVLDHSGPDLAAVQVATAVKLFIATSMIATLLNPWAGDGSALCAAANLALCVGVAAVIGTVESIFARIKLRAVPLYIVVALSAGALALLATSWRSGVAP